MGRFLILGKEERQKYLFRMLCGRGQTVTYCDSWLDGGYDAVMLPVGKSARYLEQIADKLQAGEYVFGCNFPEEIIEQKRRQGIFFVDYMKEEGAAYTNAALTAEGAIAEAILAGKEALFGRQMLVMGFGRCGQMLAVRLQALGAAVTIYEKDPEKLAIAAACGWNTAAAEDDAELIPYASGAVTIAQCSLETEKETSANGQDARFWGRFSYIFNTVPAKVLGEQRLSQLRPEAVIIDIASAPGGADYAYCAQKGINAKLCGGLPAKYAPKSAAEILLQVIESYLNLSERGGVL
uniref:Dipicolinic acid synthetase, A subunit n=1 Tax=Eubacterium plexicaudatum ASF492 TaxID=1235802 RepID=N2BDU0_9FIRM